MISRSTAVLCIFLGLGTLLMGSDSVSNNWSIFRRDLGSRSRKIQTIKEIDESVRKRLKLAVAKLLSDVIDIDCKLKSPSAYGAITFSDLQSKVREDIETVRPLAIQVKGLWAKSGWAPAASCARDGSPEKRAVDIHDYWVQALVDLEKLLATLPDDGRKD